MSEWFVAWGNVAAQVQARTRLQAMLVVLRTEEPDLNRQELREEAKRMLRDPQVRCLPIGGVRGAEPLRRD